MGTKILKSLLTAALLSCAAGYANDAVYPVPGQGEAAAPFKVSELQCQVVEGQLRCTFG